MRIIGWIVAAVLIAGGSACGGSDEAAVAVAPKNVERAASDATNHAPVIRSVRLDPAAPINGDRIHAIVSAADEDGDPIKIGFEWHISGRLIQTGEAFIDLKGVTKRDRIEVAVKVSDGRLQSDTARAEARVQNRRPTLDAIGISPQPEVFPGETLTAIAHANDPDRDPISYSYRWRVNGALQIETGDTFETDELVTGDEIQASVVASDGTADSDDLASVVVRVGNSPPKIVSVPDDIWTDEGVSYEIQAHDPDGAGPLRYALTEGPNGMRVDSVLGKLVWQATPDQAGVHRIEVAVSDAAGATSSQVFEITVNVEGDEPAAPPASARR